ncbi:hypothetical protein TIFTF001_027216 [Ficus carica]|uniref:Late embryogenesis abundant protein LEA-2 subgroup domain-containing protein n=1 Tax=Ficus carica TaxID=3494 RepID=A0AA88IY56_FICCA|nr:hypothetical protein TIFTF001_027216 [Ficus carica]
MIARRRSLKIFCGVTIIIFFTVAVVVTTLSLTVFKPKDPEVHLENFNLTYFPNGKWTIIVDLLVKIKNPDYGSFKYKQTVVDVKYQGTVVGLVPLEPRLVPARDKLNFGISSVDLSVYKMLESPKFVEDASIGSFNFTSFATLRGKVKVLKRSTAGRDLHAWEISPECKRSHIEFGIRASSMDLQDQMSKLEEIVAALANSQKEMLGHITERMEQLHQQVSDKVKDDGEHSANKSGGRGGNNSGINAFGSLNSFVPKTMKIDFPRYDGRDEPTTWVCGAEKYFSLHDIRESDKVTLASFYLKGDAQLWFQMLEGELTYVTWEELEHGIFSCFGPNQFEDPFSELILNKDIEQLY